MRRPGGGLCPYPLAHGEVEFFSTVCVVNWRTPSRLKPLPRHGRIASTHRQMNTTDAASKEAGRLHGMVREIVDHIILSKDNDNQLAMKVTCRFGPLPDEDTPTFNRGWGVVSISSLSGVKIKS